MLDLSLDTGGRYAAGLLGRHGFDVSRLDLIHPDLRPSMTTGGPASGVGSAFARHLDRGKTVEAVDLTRQVGRARLQEMIAAHDTVVTTVGPAGGGAVGIDPAAIHALAPEVALVSITPYGLVGPLADQPATEMSLFAHAGAMLVTGDDTGPPFSPTLPIASTIGGAYGAMAVALLALQPDPPADGPVIDLALRDLLTVNTERLLDWVSYLECVPHRGLGAGRPEQSAGGGVLAAADGWFYVFSGYQWFAKLAEMIGRPDLVDDAAATDAASRAARTAKINAIVAEAVALRTVEDLSARAIELHMPSGPVNTAETLGSDPQLQFRRALTVDGRGDLVIDEPFRTVAGRRAAPPVERRLPRPGATGLPLAGVRVIDLSHAFAGPTSTRILAESGADVIKVESVRRLDLLARGMLPFDNVTRGDWWERSGYFGERNLGKRAITLDLGGEVGRGLLVRLLREADVVLVNYTPRVLNAWGLGPDDLLDINPGLVVMLMSGFGQEGPRRDNPALAGTMEAASGFASYARRDGGAKPGAIGFNFGDMASGVFGATAILLALHRRVVDGVGQVIDFACAEAPLACLAPHLLAAHETGRPPSVDVDPLTGGTHVVIRCDETKAPERFVLVHLPAGGVDALNGLPVEAVDDPTPWCSPLDRDELVAILRGRGLLAVPLADALDLWHDPALRSRDAFLFGTRRSVGTLPYPRALPLLWDGAPLGRHMRTIPGLGDDTWEVLGGELGVTPAAYAGLEATGVVGTRPLGSLPKTFAVPLALDDLEQRGVLRRVPGARAELLASFVEPFPAEDGRSGPGAAGPGTQDVVGGVVEGAGQLHRATETVVVEAVHPDHG